MRRPILIGTVAALSAAGGVAVPAMSQSAPPDTTPPQVSIAFSSTQLESRLLGQGVQFGLATSENVSVVAQLSIAGRTFDPGAVVASTTTTAAGPGKQLVRMALTDRGRQLVRGAGTELMVLHVQATDAAGNRAAIADRLSRTQRLEVRRADDTAVTATSSVLGPGTKIPIDFAGYREPADGLLPAGYRIVRYEVSAVRGEREQRMTLSAPRGFSIVTLGVSQGSEVSPTVIDSDFPEHRSARVRLNFDPNKVSSGETAHGTFYVLAQRS